MMKGTSEQLVALRRALAEEHGRRPTAATAFELARAAYLLGDYDEALDRFIEAHRRAPAEPACALALARAASALGRYATEGEALSAGLRAAPAHPGLVLHDALRHVPGDLPGALTRLRVAQDDPACAEYAAALECLREGRSVPLPGFHDERALARATGTRWVQARADGHRVFCGLPVAVLERGLASASVEGLALEFGVYHGRSLRRIAAASPGQVHGFDSFEGLPEAWSAAEGPGAYSTGGRLPVVPRNAVLHVGWFTDTLPGFLAAHAGPVRFLHVDCDLYSSTRTVLEGLRDRIVPGSIIVFDDLLGYPGYEQHELRALEEFIAASGHRYEIVAAALLGREVAIRITS